MLLSGGGGEVGELGGGKGRDEFVVSSRPCFEVFYAVLHFRISKRKKNSNSEFQFNLKAVEGNPLVIIASVNS